MNYTTSETKETKETKETNKISRSVYRSTDRGIRRKLALLLCLIMTAVLVSCGSSSSEVPADKVDVDLTTLSSTMVYSEVSNMMTVPDDYMGKIVKMNGTFAVYHDETTGKDYFACIIKDATACCSQGLEFTLDGKKYPDDYPELGSDITVVGKFNTYEESGTQYCTLDNCHLI